jgi:hypothetical protein
MHTHTYRDWKSYDVCSSAAGVWVVTMTPFTTEPSCAAVSSAGSAGVRESSAARLLSGRRRTSFLVAALYL